MDENVKALQVRRSFAHGDFYPALVGACALGERLLHQMVLALREDYLNHPATTRRVRNGRLGNEWGSLIAVLQGWGVLDDGVGRQRQPALEALLALQMIKRIFIPHCALVSPAHRLEPSKTKPDEWTIYDEGDYPSDALSDEDFAQRLT